MKGFGWCLVILGLALIVFGIVTLLPTPLPPGLHLTPTSADEAGYPTEAPNDVHETIRNDWVCSVAADLDRVGSVTWVIRMASDESQVYALPAGNYDFVVHHDLPCTNGDSHGAVNISGNATWRLP